MTEEQAKKVVYDFLDGTIPYKEFVNEYHLHYEIDDYLQNILEECNNKGIELTFNIVNMVCNEELEPAFFNSPIFNYHETVESYLNWCEISHSPSTAYDIIFCLVYTIDPEVKFYRKYREICSFFIENVPEYVQGLDVQEFIEKEIIEKLPKDLSKTKLSKLCRQRIREEFGIEGNKYPHWVQSSEWPLGSDGRPAKYITKTNERGSDLVKFHFVDGGTGEEIIVEQSY